MEPADFSTDLGSIEQTTRRSNHRREPGSRQECGQAVGSLQDSYHGAAHDYERGSPHLRHALLRSEIVGRIRNLIAEQFARTGRCRVLEIGAGHGSFTDHIAATGAELTVTEMSRSSLEVLRLRLASNPRVRFVYDPDGEAVFAEAAVYDLVLCVSVLHHIPDYLANIDRLVQQTAEGGSFASFQDPLWYPRRSRVNMTLDRGAYYVWRIRQRNLLQGLATRIRRARHVYDVTNVADMVEYHVVRSGVDDSRICDLLSLSFETVEQWSYWSSQSPMCQALGASLGLKNTFGMIAQVRTPKTSIRPKSSLGKGPQ